MRGAVPGEEAGATGTLCSVLSEDPEAVTAQKGPVSGTRACWSGLGERT